MANDDNRQQRLMTASLLVIAATAAGFICNYARIVLVPFVLAMFIAVLVSPVMDWQTGRLRLPRFIAVATTSLLVLGSLFLFGYLTVRGIQTIIATAGQYGDSFSKLLAQVTQFAAGHGVDLSHMLSTEQLEQHIPELAKSAFGTVMDLISTLVLAILFLAFLLGPGKGRKETDRISAEIDRQIRRYLIIKMATSTAVGILVWLCLLMTGLESAAVFGMLAFLLNWIPSLGAIVATMLPIPVAWVQFQDPWMVVLVVAAQGAVHIVIGGIIEPKFMGDELELHPVTVLMALSFWGLVWGILGMMVAVPITSILRTVAKQWNFLQPFTDLLAGKPLKLEKKD